MVSEKQDGEIDEDDAEPGGVRDVAETPLVQRFHRPDRHILVIHPQRSGVRSSINRVADVAAGRPAHRELIVCSIQARCGATAV